MCHTFIRFKNSKKQRRVPGLTYFRDPLLGFLPSLARRLLGERMSRPTGKVRACLFTWLLLSSEIIVFVCLLFSLFFFFYKTTTKGRRLRLQGPDDDSILRGLLAEVRREVRAFPRTHSTFALFRDKNFKRARPAVLLRPSRRPLLARPKESKFQDTPQKNLKNPN